MTSDYYTIWKKHKQKNQVAADVCVDTVSSTYILYTDMGSVILAVWVGRFYVTYSYEFDVDVVLEI